MDIRVFPKALVIFLAFAFIIYGITPNSTLMDLIKLLAVAFGLALLSPLLYPHLRGVRKGDTVQVMFEEQTPIQMFVRSPFGKALENGRVGGTIRFELTDGREEEGAIVAYAGIFSPAKIKVAQKEIKVI